MPKYAMYQFDGHTFVVFDQYEQREICICQNYDGYEDAALRAKEIVASLNKALENTPEIFFTTLGK